MALEGRCENTKQSPFVCPYRRVSLPRFSRPIGLPFFFNFFSQYPIAGWETTPPLYRTFLHAHFSLTLLNNESTTTRACCITAILFLIIWHWAARTTINPIRPVVLIGFPHYPDPLFSKISSGNEPVYVFTTNLHVVFFLCDCHRHSGRNWIKKLEKNHGVSL